MVPRTARTADQVESGIDWDRMLVVLVAVERTSRAVPSARNLQDRSLAFASTGLSGGPHQMNVANSGRQVAKEGVHASCVLHLDKYPALRLVSKVCNWHRKNAHLFTALHTPAARPSIVTPEMLFLTVNAGRSHMSLVLAARLWRELCTGARKSCLCRARCWRWDRPYGVCH